MKDLEKEERLLDLLSKRAIFALDADEQRELEGLLEIFPEWRDDDTFSLTAAAVSLSALDTREEMPLSLRNKILEDSNRYFAGETEEETRTAPVLSSVPRSGSNVIEFKPKRSNWNWLGWAVAAAASVALVVSIWLRPVPQGTDLVQVPPVFEAKTTMAQMRQEMMDSSADMIKGTWTGGMPEMKDMGGDVVWSDAKQMGYMRLTGLPANDGTKETYQLWIFDETQDPKTPIDGGVFNVNANGEVIIPINAKLKAKNPSMFAITMEKPGGVVVSKREKMVALAKVQI
jgi:anti-sigma-K factor RskA